MMNRAVLGVLLVSAVASANVGSGSAKTKILACGTKAKATFSLEQTATPTLQKGILNLHGGGPAILLNCKSEAPLSPQPVNSFTTVFSCEEDRAGEALVHANITDGGMQKDNIHAVFSRQGLFPNSPEQEMFDLKCKLLQADAS